MKNCLYLNYEKIIPAYNLVVSLANVIAKKLLAAAGKLYNGD